MKLLVLLAVVSLAVASWDRRCRDERSCRGEKDPCKNVMSDSCPRYFFYACPKFDRRWNNCTCEFYRESDNRRIRQSNCFRQIERCCKKSCDDDSDCNETTVFCEHGKRCDFDRKIEAKCIKRSCDNMKCSKDKECRMFRSRDGAMRPRCAWRDERDCYEKMCQWGQKCEMRREKPICREETEEEKCRSIRCREGYRCGNGTCILKSCAEMNCRRDEECMDWNRGMERIRRCIRRPSRDRRCEDLDCEEGFECEMRKDRPMCRRRRAPAMSPPRRFEEISCRRNDTWAMCETENGDRFARCWRRDARWPNSSRDDRWRRDWERDDRRRPPRNCSELWCWENERCQIFRYMKMQIASCYSDRTPKDCRSARCEDNERCHLLNNSEVRSHAVCFRNLSRREEPRREAENCNELRCEKRFTCFRRRDENGRWRARCRRTWHNKSPRCWRREISNWWQSRNERQSWNREWWRKPNDTKCWSDRWSPEEWRRAERDRAMFEERRRQSDEDRRRFRDEERRRFRDDRRWNDNRRNRPDQCSEIECGRNETCFVDTREGRRWARCIPMRWSDRAEWYCWARSCKEMECEEGFTCEERRETREVNETREDRDRWQRRRDEDRWMRENRRREDRDWEDRRAREDRMREEERCREDEKWNKTREEEDRNCRPRAGDWKERREEERDDDRCERRNDDRRREDRDRRERRRREDWEWERECRRRDRDRDEARRNEDREREERWKREEKYVEWRRRDECHRRGAQCVRK